MDEKMKRLAHFDVGLLFSRPSLQFAARLALGLACGLGMVAIRLVLDMSMPGSGPFALVYPAVLLATLYGRWEAGIVAYAIGFAWSYARIMPPTGLETASAGTINHLVLHAISAIIVLAFAERFRTAVEAAQQHGEQEIERRAVLLAELEHRTKNNFALVASLLELQKRKEDSEPIRRAFDDAIGRVQTFSEAYTHLAGEQGEGVMVEMRPYLDRMVARASNAMLPPQVRISSRFAEASLPREAAVAIGLFANEALTNCAKYAFPEGRDGTVEMTFDVSGDEWRLFIRDNGAGEGATPPPHASGGIGTQLLEAFARQAKARHTTSYTPGGCEVSLIYESESG
ncbi:sensor histidine kinase [Novosphingobium sp. M1R2S20]|uniref:histidine kinase n=1 Tax=Novosphingobium rhizovicinum TaxID=3228928 RepID=A0ABV3RFH9_9SPHN